MAEATGRTVDRPSPDEFIRRFLLHVLPTGFHRIRLGLEDRSSRPAEPSASNRAAHFLTVLTSTPSAVATATFVSPAFKRRTIAARLPGVVRAFLCRFIRSSENR